MHRMTVSGTRPQLPFPTLLSSPGLQPPVPRTTPAPTCCEPSEVVVELSTTLLIQDYARFYGAPISDFQPAYTALPDGSLATAPFIDDLASSHLTLMATGMLAIVFLRNICVSFEYLNRAIVKRKLLFYLLLCSQLLSLGMVPLLVSYFTTRLNCTVAVSIASSTACVSVSLLMTGVLALKAYRCLDGSRAVLFCLVAFFCASSIVLALQSINTRGLRRLSGGCQTISLNPEFTKIYVLIQLAHSLFLCCCFLYVIWKSRSSPAARGRLSLRVSLVDFPDTGSHKPTRRAWWKSLLGRRDNLVPLPDPDSSSPTQEKSPTASLRAENGVTNLDLTLKQPSRSFVEPGAQSHTPTTSLPWFIPPMELFQKVMKDELCYTTTITGATVVLALLLVFGTNRENSLDMFGWLGANWAVISLLAIHSFGRVVRRHEKEALLQHPSAWSGSPAKRPTYAAQRTYSGSQRPRLRLQDDDPFSDSRALRDSVTSWNSESPLTPTPAAYMRGRSSYPDVPTSIRPSLLSLPDGEGPSDYPGDDRVGEMAENRVSKPM